MKYRNPVIPGFYPDPSVCRVGEDYYLVTSSFEYFPGVPIFHSKDLIHWRQIGHCLTRASQLPLKNAWISGGIYAPTIRHHQGKFYMITTNVSDGGHFFVTADDPAGEWSEPVWVEGKWIDPSLFFDDDGRVYFQHSGGGIWQTEIDIQTGKHLTPFKLLSPGMVGKDIEGPHLYKIKGKYYLMAAEGGTEYNHMEVIGRSDTPWGPFEHCPHNPILTHRGYNSPIQATGHAELFEVHDGSWWMVFLGIRPNGYPPCYHLGRETFLAPVRWTEDGWPVVGMDGRVALEMEAETLPLHPWQPVDPHDDFVLPKPGLQWNYLRNPYPEDYNLTDRPGWLRLWGSAVTLDAQDSPAWLGRRQQHFLCTAKTYLDFEPREDGEEAGLTVFQNFKHHYEIAVRWQAGERCVFVRRRIGSLVAEVGQAALAPGPVTLILQANRDWYVFGFQQGSAPEIELAQGETRYLSTEVGGMFTGVYFAMYATGNGKRSTVPADFDWFEYLPGEE